MTRIFTATRVSIRIRVARVAITLISVVAAFPLWAHGEQLVVVFFGVLVVAPLVLLLLLPWRGWRIRLGAVMVFILCTLLLWLVVLPRNDMRIMSSAAEWVLLLSPTITAVAAEIVLRRFSKGSAA